MKRTCALLAVLLLAPLSALHAAEFHVAPHGNDAHPGTKAKPFATLERAQSAVRESKIQNPTANIQVLVRGGTYELRQTLKLDATDSGTEEAPVVWRAYWNEQPILSGGGKITGFVPHEGSILTRLPARFPAHPHRGDRLLPPPNPRKLADARQRKAQAMRQARVLLSEVVCLEEG